MKRKEASPQPHYSLSPAPSTASPPPPLRMERGVDSVVCKQRERFFDMKRRPFHCKETPSSNEEGRSFNFKILLPLYLSGIGVHVNGSIHAPLHSERGKGVRLQSRDRHPRLETPPSLPKGEECLTGASLDQYFRLKITPQSRDRRPRLSAHLRRLVNKKLSV